MAIEILPRLRLLSFDWLLPLSLLGLPFDSGKNLMGFLLVIWLVLRLVQRVDETPLAWSLIGILSFSMASLLQPTTRSHLVDPLLLCISFAVGTARSAADWRRSLSVIALILLPASALVRFDPEDGHRDLTFWQSLHDRVPMRLPDIAINDSAYIFMVLTLCAWLLLRWGVRAWARGPVALLVLLGLGVLYGTASRAGLLTPLLIACALEVIWRLRGFLQQVGWQSYCLLLAMGLVFSLLVIHPSSPLTELNDSDTGRAYVGRCFWREAIEAPIPFLTGHGGDVVNERCNRATRWSLQPKGLRHAHNQYLQTLADYGLIPLLVLLVGAGVCWCHAIHELQGAEPLPALISLMMTLVLMSFSLIESVLLAISFKQILTGYLLAAAWSSSSLTFQSK